MYNINVVEMLHLLNFGINITRLAVSTAVCFFAVYIKKNIKSLFIKYVTNLFIKHITTVVIYS